MSMLKVTALLMMPIRHINFVSLIVRWEVVSITFSPFFVFLTDNNLFSDCSFLNCDHLSPDIFSLSCNPYVSKKKTSVTECFVFVVFFSSVSVVLLVSDVYIYKYIYNVFVCVCSLHTCISCMYRYICT